MVAELVRDLIYFSKKIEKVTPAIKVFNSAF